MNYTKKITGLLKEATQFAQYKRLPAFNKYGMAVCLLPLIIYDLYLIACYFVAAFVLKGLSTPVEVLHSFVKKERNAVRHATEAVLYAVTMPFIFLYNIVLAMFSFYFYILWFLIMVVTYVVTMGGIKWQPFITEAEFDGNYNYEVKPGDARAKKLTFIPVVCLIVVIVLAIVSFVLSIASPILATVVGGNAALAITTIIAVVNAIISVASALASVVLDIVTYLIIPIMFGVAPASKENY